MYFERSATWESIARRPGLQLRGRAAFAGSLFADAIMPLSRYVRSHPDDVGARSVLGISQFMTANYPGCIEALQPVIAKSDLAPQVAVRLRRVDDQDRANHIRRRATRQAGEVAIRRFPMYTTRPGRKHWVNRERSNGRLKNFAPPFNSARKMPMRTTISARWNSTVGTPQQRFRNLKQPPTTPNNLRNFIGNWLMPTRRLFGRQMHRKRLKPLTCSTRAYKALHRTSRRSRTTNHSTVGFARLHTLRFAYRAHEPL